MIKFILYGLLLALSAFGMDEEIKVSGVEIAFTLSDGAVKKPKELVALFSMFNIFDTPGLNVNLELAIPVDAPSKIFNKWFSFVKNIAVNKNGNVMLPEAYPLPLQDKIYRDLDNLSFDDYQLFINVGDKLGVPNTLMDYVCNFFNQKFLSRIKTDAKFVIGNPVTQAYFSGMPNNVKNVLMLSSNLLKQKVKNTFNIKPILNEYGYVYSQNGSFLAYFHRKRNDSRRVYFFDFLKKEVKATVQQHVINNDAKNTKKFIRCAAQEPCFFTIVPHDDRILIHHIRDREKNRVINLNLKETQKINCCDISADGNYVVVGYGADDEKNSKFVLYDQIGKAHTIPINRALRREEDPAFCVCNPADPTAGILTTKTLNQQYIAILGGNIVIEPFGTATAFLEGKQLFNMIYNPYGKYIFALSDDDDQNITAYRLDAEFLSKKPEEHILPIPWRPWDQTSQLFVNDQGDILIYKFGYQEDGKHKHGVIITDYIHNRAYRIAGDDIRSCCIKDYLLIYIEMVKKEDEYTQYTVFFDLLHKKELMREQVNNDTLSIIGITQDYELIVKRDKLYTGVDGDRLVNRVQQSLLFITFMEQLCWEQISQYIDTYNFLPTDANWLQQLYFLVNMIQDQSIISVQDWLQKSLHVFSNDFLDLLVECKIVDAKDIQEIKEKRKNPKKYEAKSELLSSMHRLQKPLVSLAAKSKQIKPARTTVMLPTQPSAVRVTAASQRSVQPVSQSQPPASQQPAPQPNIFQRAANWIINTGTQFIRWFFGLA